MIVDDRAVYVAAVMQVLIRNSNYQYNNVAQMAPELARAAWDVAEIIVDEGKVRRRRRHGSDSE